MSIDLKKFKDFLDSEEGQKSLEEYFGGLKKEAEESREYFESEDFLRNLELIKKWMIQHSIFEVDGDDFNEDLGVLAGYYDNKNGVTIPMPIKEDIFYKIASSISDSLDASEKIDPEMPFSNSYIDYNEWRLSYIHGQGTITRLTLDRSKMRDHRIKNIINSI